MFKLAHILLFLCLTHLSVAKSRDSLHIMVESRAGAASSTYQPFWHTANRWQSIPEEGSYFLFNASISHHFQWRHHWRAKYEGQFIGFLNQRSGQLAQAHGSVAYKKLQLSAGRFRQYWGETDSLLSSGSLGISGNALPVPAIELSLNEYVAVPFTQGWLQFKGRWQHGWLGQEQYVKGAYLHAKNFYIQLGNDHVTLQGGLNHFAQWGGHHPHGDLPNRLQDYQRIMLGKPQKKENAFTDAPQDVHNALGNHILITDIGIQWKFKHNALKVYTQTPYETGRNEKIYGRDNIDGFYILGKDRLLGLVIKQSSFKLIDRILMEYLYTVHQGGTGMFIGQFNYYNHSIYRSGWTYQRYSIGTPLFMTQQQAAIYLPPDAPLGNHAFVSNRVQTMHLGLSGKPGNYWHYRNVLTYTRHYGTYYNTQAFIHPRKQIYALTEWSYSASPSLALSASTAIDFGNLSDNIGFALGIQWQYVSATQ